MNDLSGQTIDRYHILEQIGEGGMAFVYKAYDTRLEREVAIKLIRKEAFPPESIDRIFKRFEREAKALAKLSHPNIVKVHDYGEYEGSPYLVMEFQPAGTLKSMLGKPLSWDAISKFLIPIANALGYAHQQGILHRDVKPSNILITHSGDPMLTDFGIAKILDLSDGQTLTGTGLGVGTPEYMAPEQGLGKEVDARADIYSLGVVLYELVTGQKPYTADTPMAVIFKHMTDPLPRPGKILPGLSEDIEILLMKTMAKDPTNRYQNMAELSIAMEKVSTSNINLRGNDEIEIFQTKRAAFSENTNDEFATPKLIDVSVGHRKSKRISLKAWGLGITFLMLFGLLFLGYSLINVKLQSQAIVTNNSIQNPDSDKDKNKNSIATIVINTNIIIPTSEVVSAALVDSKEDFINSAVNGVSLDGDSTIVNGNLKLKGISGAYFHNILFEGKSILIKFKYSKDTVFSIIAHNDQEWDGPMFRRFGIYDAKGANPFFLAVTNGIDYIADNSWVTGTLIPESDHWYLLFLTIGGKDTPFYLKVWDSVDPTKFMEMRKMLGKDWESPNWHFRIGVDSGEMLVDYVEELRSK